MSLVAKLFLFHKDTPFLREKKGLSKAFDIVGILFGRCYIA
jgi:hypothetical protein